MTLRLPRLTPSGERWMTRTAWIFYVGLAAMAWITSRQRSFFALDFELAVLVICIPISLVYTIQARDQ
jgi:hypothetical protein